MAAGNPQQQMPLRSLGNTVSHRVGQGQGKLNRGAAHCPGVTPTLARWPPGRNSPGSKLVPLLQRPNAKALTRQAGFCFSPSFGPFPPTGSHGGGSCRVLLCQLRPPSDRLPGVRHGGSGASAGRGSGGGRPQPRPFAKGTGESAVRLRPTPQGRPGDALPAPGPPGPTPGPTTWPAGCHVLSRGAGHAHPR